MSARPGVLGVLRDERGSATIMGLAAAAVVLLAFTSALYLVAATAARHRTEAAADLAALTAASRLLTGAEQACATAGRVASRMAARMTRCELDGWHVVVHVEGVPPPLLVRLGVPRATARAGPALGGVR
ncbi:MAG TPA: Rv3654c family TadE-like protein [Pseudonocardiaceae bacterium]